MLQEAAHIVAEAGKTMDSFIFWEITSGITAFVGYAIWNLRYQHKQDLALLRLESDRDNHSEQLDEFSDDLKNLVKMVTHIDRIMRRLATSQGIHVREDD
jgi:hypothetical protein